MSELLETICASRPVDDALFYCLRLSCPIWGQTIDMALSEDDETVTHENGQTVTYLASNVAVKLPSKDPTGTEELTFQIDGVTEVALPLIRQAQINRQPVTAELRQYARSNTAVPQNSYSFRVKNAAGNAVQLKAMATFPEIINAAFPAIRNTPENSPGTVHM